MFYLDSKFKKELKASNDLYLFRLLPFQDLSDCAKRTKEYFYYLQHRLGETNFLDVIFIEEFCFNYPVLLCYSQFQFISISVRNYRKPNPFLQHKHTYTPKLIR